MKKHAWNTCSSFDGQGGTGVLDVVMVPIAITVREGFISAASASIRFR
jgi:hypothetical protein